MGLPLDLSFPELFLAEAGPVKGLSQSTGLAQCEDAVPLLEERWRCGSVSLSHIPQSGSAAEERGYAVAVRNLRVCFSSFFFSIAEKVQTQIYALQNIYLYEDSNLKGHFLQHNSRLCYLLALLPLPPRGFLCKKGSFMRHSFL